MLKANWARILASAYALAAVALLVQAEAAVAAKASPPPAQTPVDMEHLETAFKAGRLVQLKSLIERAKLARQTDPRIDLYLAEYWLQSGQAEQAMAQFQQLSGVSAVSARAYQGVGVSAPIFGQVEKATGSLQQAVALDPSLVRAWNALGAAADRQKNWTLAEQAYGEALRLNPSASSVLSNRGYSRMLQGRHADAVTDLTAAIRLEPAEPKVQNNLRMALALSGRYDEAFSGVSRRDLHRELNNIGYAALLRGDYVSAEAYLSRAIEVSDVFYRRAWQNLVYLGDLKPDVRLASK